MDKPLALRRHSDKREISCQRGQSKQDAGSRIHKLQLSMGPSRKYEPMRIGGNRVKSLHHVRTPTGVGLEGIFVGELRGCSLSEFKKS